MKRNVLKAFLALLIIPFISGVAMAAKIDIGYLRSSWGNPELGKCGNVSNVGTAAIGTKRNVCVGSGKEDRRSECLLGDDYGVLLLIARTVNENGAYFCPTTVYGEKEKNRRSWTLYGDSSKGGSGCFWACKPGFGGPECSKTSDFGCDPETVFRDDFNSYSMTREPQIEDLIPMFYLNEDQECTFEHKWFLGYRHNEEHDMFLAVVGWLPSGHGVIAQPVTAQANQWSKRSQEASIIVYLAGSPTVLCKNGYTLNTATNDCEVVDSEVCALTQMCPGLYDTMYDEATMSLDYDADRDCYVYKCSEPGYAFRSGVDLECLQCVTNMRTGVNPEDGTCVTCEIGEIFDADAASTGYCSRAVGYKKSDMQYGVNETKDTVPLNDQCWMIATPDEYSNCVRGIEENLPSGVSRAVTAVSVTGGSSRLIPAAN